MVIQEERLADLFVRLCEIDSPSRQEGRIAAFVRTLFSEEFPGCSLFEDDSARVTGSESGNILIRFPGSLSGEALLFNCHLDTVQPGTNVKVQRTGTVFTSRGDTVLGGDDKAGIAILIEVMRAIQEAHLPHHPVEFLFTTCEEIGLLGAKALDPTLLTARTGFALDTCGTDRVIVGAPASDHFIATITGKAAHAGLNPEDGINAIQIAGKVLSRLSLGRLDPDTTANVGRITGGTATNIVPASVRLEGEARCHSEARLDRLVETIRQTFATVIAEERQHGQEGPALPAFSFEVVRQFPAMRIAEQDRAVQRLRDAERRLGRSFEYLKAGGGSDANIFNGIGIQTVILGTGMDKVHSTDECIDLRDMTKTAQIVSELLTG